MKNKILKPGIVSLVFSALLLLSGFITVENNCVSPPVVKDIHAYIIKNVMPVMKPHRHEFNKQLSKEEISQTEVARKELKEIIKTRRKAEIPSDFRELLTSRLSDKQINVLKETRSRAYKVFLKAAIIAENHEKELEKIFMTENKNVQKWSKDIEKIIQKNSRKRLFGLNSNVKENIIQLLPAENFNNILFVLWNPDETYKFNFNSNSN
ncbi:MAG: hypothetical protein K8R54_01560 [Bacteroidales bacterium]|nr:hypothetical protein [Bacteroidales bacterium]